MPLVMTEARRTDAARISEIHMAAFGSNRMLQAQFRMPALHEPLRACIEAKALADTDDPKTTVLVVRDEVEHHDNKSSTPDRGDYHEPSEARQLDEEEEGRIIAFAKWAHPVLASEDYTEPPWKWPAGTDLDLLEAWTKKTEEAQERALGSDAPCYRLTFMGTDPLHERRGAASMLVRWGLRQSETHRVPAYLESTVEAAPFYERRGLAAVQPFSLMLEGTNSGPGERYEEISFVFDVNAKH